MTYPTIKRRIEIFDTTLRDGEQSPGVALSPGSKLKVARQLDRLGVDMIEAGFPAVSPGEMEGVRLIARDSKLKARIYGLARAEKRDIDAIAEAGLRNAHVFIATSETHLKYKLGITQQEAMEKASGAVAYSKSLGLRVLFSAEDATGTKDRQFLRAVYRAAEKAGADEINIPDTTGRATPEQIAELTGDMVSAVCLPVSIHCHNDLGLATANTRAAIMSGAVCAQVTINGIGERAGNASLEQIVAVLHNLEPRFETGVDTTLIYQTSKMVSEITRMLIQPNQPIIGANAFTHEAGIHAHGVLMNPETYEFLRPDEFGRASKIVIGKHAGRHNINALLGKNGISLSPDSVNSLLRDVKEITDNEGTVTEAQLLGMAGKLMGG
ncbi:MAG TPA: hypothetical protein VL945_01795 [Candidatus Saccharimonadales bacterium]|nr:hypothetical protein [Candidatus Saccharimonadales bacterium]